MLFNTSFCSPDFLQRWHQRWGHYSKTEWPTSDDHGCAARGSARGDSPTAGGQKGQ